jgi:hypothetical protein
MLTVSLYLIVTVIVFGLGYAVGWNRALHPGKVEGQLASAAATVKEKL